MEIKFTPRQQRAALGQEILRRRQARGWTQRQLVERIEELCGKSDNATISRIECGKQGHSEKQLNSIAQALECSVADLFRGGREKRNEQSVPIGARRVPLLSWEHAGRWMETLSLAEFRYIADAKWKLISGDLAKTASQYTFAVNIDDDSMAPAFLPGDTIIIDPSLLPRPGNFVVATCGDNVARVRAYRQRRVDGHGNMIFALDPINVDYPVVTSDLIPIRIIGTVVERRRKFYRACSESEHKAGELPHVD